MKEPANRSALLLEEMVDPKHVNTVLLEGYGENLTDVEMEVIGQDPFLIAYAMADHKNRCVVTVETSAPSRSRARRKLPDVCSGFSLQCCDPFQFYHGVGFRTSWK